MSNHTRRSSWVVALALLAGAALAPATRAADDPRAIAAEAYDLRLAGQVDEAIHFVAKKLESAVAEVIAEASRYTSTRIVIDDAELETLHVTGYFKAGDVETLLRLIESNEQVAIRHAGPDLVRITSRAD